VDLFNFWLEKGNAPEDEEESTHRIKVGYNIITVNPRILISSQYAQQLANWVRNNWHPYSTTSETKPNLKINPINLVWETHRETVEDELQEILGVDRLDPKHPGYFQQHNAAAKHVIQKMNEQELAELNAIVDERRTHGNPDHIKRE
jgi:hypothetical protein